MKNIHIVVILTIITLFLYFIVNISFHFSIGLALITTAAFVTFNIFNIRCTLFIKSISIIKTTENFVYLTFDDGPVQGVTNKILDILDQYNIKACFFCIGKNIEINKELALRISNSGHLIGNHTYTHSWKDTFVNTNKYVHEIETCNKLIKSINSQNCYIYRPPFSITNPNIAKAIKLQNMHTIGWNIRSFDTVIKNKDKIIARIITRLKPGSIILFHNLPITVEILPILIKEINNKGYKILSLPKFTDACPNE